MLAPGFSDPVLASQAVFRTVMEAMARPGSIAEIDVAIAPPAPLGTAAAALALTLLDFETPFWLDPALAAAPEVDGWLKFHTGARRTADPASAAFAFVVQPAAMPGFDAFSLGSSEYPDGSTTLVLEVETLTDDDAFRLTGPGISDRGASPRLRCRPTSPHAWRKTARCFRAGSISCSPAGSGSPRCRGRCISRNSTAAWRSLPDVRRSQRRRTRHRECARAARRTRGAAIPPYRNSVSSRSPSSSRSRSTG